MGSGTLLDSLDYRERLDDLGAAISFRRARAGVESNTRGTRRDRGRVVWFYLEKLFWPHPLIFIYPRWQIDPSRPLAYLPFAAAALLIFWRGREGWARPVFFALAYFVISLLPALGFFNVYFFRYSFVGDHLQYLASIAAWVLATHPHPAVRNAIRAVELAERTGKLTTAASLRVNAVPAAAMPKRDDFQRRSQRPSAVCKPQANRAMRREPTRFGSNSSFIAAAPPIATRVYRRAEMADGFAEADPPLRWPGPRTISLSPCLPA